MAERTFDVVVIGGGAVGENVAARAVQGGLTAALVEYERFGGECSYWACMPSKALLRPGNLLAALRRMPGVGEGARLDPAEVFARRDSFVSHWDDSSQVDWARGADVEAVRGRARITGEREVTLGDGSVLRAKHGVVLCTGSMPKRPPVEGLDAVRGWTSREATSASEVPGTLAVLGAGVAGVELAQAWARLGASVELIATGPRPLPRYPDFAGDAVAEGLREDGVRLHTETRAEKVSTVDGKVRVELSGGTTLDADELLVATGRRPATADLGLDVLGLKPGEPLEVDDTGLVLGVDGEWLYAAGDVTGRALLTHQGKYAARVVGDVLAAKAAGQRIDTTPWSRHTATADHHAVPQVIFTDPEVASVGLTGSGDDRHRVVDLDIAVAGSALHADGYAGTARMVVDTEREVLLGVTFVGQDVAEMLHAATIAVVGEVPLRRLWHAVPAFPTISEVWLRLLEEYGL